MAAEAGGLAANEIGPMPLRTSQAIYHFQIWKAIQTHGWNQAGFGPEKTASVKIIGRNIFRGSLRVFLGPAIPDTPTRARGGADWTSLDKLTRRDVS